MMKNIFFACCFFLMNSHITHAQITAEITPVPGLINFQNLRDYCLNASGDEDFFTIQSPNGEISQIATRKKTNSGWSSPELMPFCDAFMYLEPFLATNGLTLYFVSDRPLNDGDTTKKDFDIWMVKRAATTAAWSEPVNLGTTVNSTNDEFYPSLTTSGDLYFTMAAPEGMGKDDIYMCKMTSTGYEKPTILPSPINSAGYEFNAFISPDGNILIYTKYNAPGGFGSGDLYIAKKDNGGNWQEPQNMGTDLNSMYMEYCPFYHYPTATLYFTSRRCNLIPKTFNDVNELQQYISGNENGNGRLYYRKMKIE